MGPPSLLLQFAAGPHNRTATLGTGPPTTQGGADQAEQPCTSSGAPSLLQTFSDRDCLFRRPEGSRPDRRGVKAGPPPPSADAPIRPFGVRRSSLRTSKDEELGSRGRPGSLGDAPAFLDSSGCPNRKVARLPSTEAPSASSRSSTAFQSARFLGGGRLESLTESSRNPGPKYRRPYQVKFAWERLGSGLSDIRREQQQPDLKRTPPASQALGARDTPAHLPRPGDPDERRVRGRRAPPAPRTGRRRGRAPPERRRGRTRAGPVEHGRGRVAPGPPREPPRRTPPPAVPAYGDYDDDDEGQVYGDDDEYTAQAYYREQRQHRGGGGGPRRASRDANITDDEYRYGSGTGDDDDGSPYSDDDDDSVASAKSYEDAGYDNEEDYLFDQYGGIGGTAEERAELAEALMHTLNVGPMADDLFYEEVAMCFLRCRERHRMRTRREEQRERKRMKRRASKKKSRGQAKSGQGAAG
ncbi:hypothetical protein THAOC_19279, partial [Thalassiosira oceanica]